MKLVVLASILPALALAARPGQFNVAPSGVACGKGTTISVPDAGAKGNFNPAQSTVVNLKVSGNCHISLYPQANQGGGVSQRLNTDTTGTCITGGPWKSYGYYCD
ncbi:hypothetical protein BCR34DRAFT_585452 [Clohesyomyces aquaticus]|uniref:Uncharacterized protein n=1 Tax=Clohesyomyces aquaticus TaxID=1231657 RepID=A0A1Y1ZXC8_9PLEO|nr:hypothetical protein BCR34DRAFT_585452 [Clohesyomyces aquaticus]